MTYVLCYGALVFSVSYDGPIKLTVKCTIKREREREREREKEKERERERDYVFFVIYSLHLLTLHLYTCINHIVNFEFNGWVKIQNLHKYHYPGRPPKDDPENVATSQPEFGSFVSYLPLLPI